MGDIEENQCHSVTIKTWGWYSSGHLGVVASHHVECKVIVKFLGYLGFHQTQAKTLRLKFFQIWVRCAVSISTDLKPASSSWPLLETSRLSNFIWKTFMWDMKCQQNKEQMEEKIKGKALLDNCSFVYPVNSSNKYVKKVKLHLNFNPNNCSIRFQIIS